MVEMRLGVKSGSAGACYTRLFRVLKLSSCEFFASFNCRENIVQILRQLGRGHMVSNQQSANGDLIPRLNPARNLGKSFFSRNDPHSFIMSSPTTENNLACPLVCCGDRQFPIRALYVSRDTINDILLECFGNLFEFFLDLIQSWRRSRFRELAVDRTMYCASDEKVVFQFLPVPDVQRNPALFCFCIPSTDRLDTMVVRVENAIGDNSISTSVL